ncbi:hypothetical protein A2U01_0116478, partial [Trifolium medium]|nr:hypothetical protein [Trifolium medium]
YEGSPSGGLSRIARALAAISLELAECRFETGTF